MTFERQVRARILIHTPAFVKNGQHVAMLAVQSQLAARLRRYLSPEVQLVTALIVDFCDPELCHKVAEISKAFDLVKWSIPQECGTQWGIRKGTNYAVTRVAEEACATHVLRVIQDTYVYDTIALCQQIEDAIAISGDWIAAKIHHWPVKSHEYLCHEMRIECSPDLRYSNGEFMFAPVETWRRWYVTLPEQIHHYWDDVMMSESFRQRGHGQQLDWRQCWAHRHDLDELTSARIARAQALALSAHSGELPSSSGDDVIPSFGVCAIARNEEFYIGEWLAFHRLVGVKHFWIYCDDEVDSPMRAEIDRCNCGDVTVIDWPRTQNRQSHQLAAYEHFLKMYPQAADWVAFIDVDEFLYSPTGVDVPVILKTYEDIDYHGGVFVNWLFYGDNYHSTRPGGLTIANFTRRGVVGEPNCQGKTIVRMSSRPCFPSNPHAAAYPQGGLSINEHRSWAPNASSRPPSIELLRINHYFHRSKEEAEIKRQRRNARGFSNRKVSDMDRHNLNDIIDDSIHIYLPELQRSIGLVNNK